MDAGQHQKIYTKVAPAAFTPRCCYSRTLTSLSVLIPRKHPRVSPPHSSNSDPSDGHATQWKKSRSPVTSPPRTGAPTEQYRYAGEKQFRWAGIATIDPLAQFVRKHEPEIATIDPSSS